MSGAVLARFSRIEDVTRIPTRFWRRRMAIRAGLPDFEDTSPNPRCLSACRGSTRQYSGGVEAGSDGAEQILMRTGAGEHQSDARVLRTTTAPILNRVNRIRFGLAVASAVFDSASRRNPSIKV